MANPLLERKSLRLLLHTLTSMGKNGIQDFQKVVGDKPNYINDDPYKCWYPAARC